MVVLPDPFGPEDADDLAGADLEIDMVDRDVRRSAWSALARSPPPALALSHHALAPLPASGRSAAPRPSPLAGEGPGAAGRCAHSSRAGRSGRRRTRRPAGRCAMMPIADRAPQGRGQHGDAEIGRFRQPAGRVGADRRLVVAGDRLLRRGQRHLDVAASCRRRAAAPASDRISDFQPSGAVALSSMSRAASLPSLRNDDGQLAAPGRHKPRR